MAQILTSISGLPISAASAGFAPTNSSEVSAIASGYQVVSSTATQLYAGSAYLTSVNDVPVSASRAGQAENASMANSAYYDGTGRLISDLPDEATVSSIASSYAESAASSKLDTTAQVVTATGSANVDWWGLQSAMVSSINGSAILPYGFSALAGNSANWTSVYNTVSSNSASWGGVDSATVSAIASSYAEGAASGKLDSSASSSFYTTANESGFITGVDLSPYQTTADMSAYQPSGDYIYASSLGTGTI